MAGAATRHAACGNEERWADGQVVAEQSLQPSRILRQPLQRV